MALISVILGLFLDRVFRHLHDLRDMTWFEVYTQKIHRFSNKFGRIIIPSLQFILIIAPPVLLILTIQVQLNNILFNLPSFAFGIIIFIYCLGPACLSSDVEAYINARANGDEDEALHYAGSITGKNPSPLPDQQTIDVTHSILYVANERVFSTIFWFVILGPSGAIFYRLISELSKQEISNLSTLSTLMHSIMAWIPARMLAVGYALTGNFDNAFQGYKSRAISSEYSATDFAQDNYNILVSTGLGAMLNTEAGDELASVYAAQALVMRAVIVWVGILAVLTLGGIFN